MLSIHDFIFANPITIFPKLWIISHVNENLLPSMHITGDIVGGHISDTRLFLCHLYLLFILSCHFPMFCPISGNFGQFLCM